MHIQCFMHSPATLQPAQRHPMYCDKSSNRFWIQAVGDSQNELPSFLKSFRNLKMQNRLLLKKIAFFTTFLLMGVTYSTSVQNNLSARITESFVVYQNQKQADSHSKSETSLDQRGLQTVAEVKTKILIQQTNCTVKQHSHSGHTLHVGMTNSTQYLLTLSPVTYAGYL